MELFNIMKFCETRPLSWSAISSFEYDPEQWFQRYIKGIKDPENPAMAFGKFIGQKISSEPTFLTDVLRYPQFEKCLEATVSGIKLIGFLDSYDPETKAFYEYKTSGSITRWTQKTAQEHGQILMYKLLLWINYNIKPETIKSSLFYIPVGEINGVVNLNERPVQQFDLLHTSTDVLNFAAHIIAITKEMERYAQSRLV